ncbi:MAG: acetyl-CoA C-acetyltransferase [Dehalobacterium sp.]
MSVSYRSSEKIVIAGAVRTAVGKFGGTLSEVPAERLGAIVIQEALSRTGIPASEVDEVIMGCVIQAGLGQNVARQAAIHAGLSVEIPAVTVNNVCGSGLKSINMAAALILSGEAEVIVAGGMENMSSAPYILKNARFGYRMNDGLLGDAMISDALWDAFHSYHMGITAENIAERFHITRERQDEFAAISQQKCEAAMNSGRFKDEIVPVVISSKKGDIFFNCDENPRQGVTAESISKLKAAFKKDGTVTAANSSGINDGAAAVVLMRAQKAKELGVHPMACFIAGASAGIEPEFMGLGAAKSVEKLLNKTGLKINDLDLIELNEAFAAQSIAVAHLLKLNLSRVNVNGGAIALGHPVGASGCRIFVTLIHELWRRGGGRGLASLCVGGGMGVSSIVEI